MLKGARFINTAGVLGERDTLGVVIDFLEHYDRSLVEDTDLVVTLGTLFRDRRFQDVLQAFIEAPIFSTAFSEQFAAADVVAALSTCRMLRGCLNLSLHQFFARLAQLFAACGGVETDASAGWSRLAERIAASLTFKDLKVIRYLTDFLEDDSLRARYAELASQLEITDPHAIYPTSSYRECDGHVVSAADDQTIEAVMTVRTFSSMRIVDRTLAVEQPLLRDIYAPLGRCLCLVDATVESLYAEDLEGYFAHHRIPLVKYVYRALEVDKSIQTVERMLGDLKSAGISRNEPVLIVGGGVLADTGGLACALYGRNTPYVMLATSIVAGIDAGPSPRTCCDGYGYKNLLGAYHPPAVSIVDRYFFKTLRSIWLRHGIAEIIKISIVRDAQLFADLETAQRDLIATKFGTIGCDAADPIATLSQKILGAALRSYVAAEYDNLYETHQCRPHAYGHTWSPGFEIEADLLHGHAVAVCMGLGAYISYRLRWITGGTLRRILDLIDGFGLSLWHDILDDREKLWRSQQIVVQKRGQNLVAPLPKGEIGECGYLNELARDDLFSAIAEYKEICTAYPRGGRGIDALCSDADAQDLAALPSSPIALYR